MRQTTFVPAQVATAELVDGAVSDHALLRANLRDMALANRWLGADSAVLGRVAAWIGPLPRAYRPTILDVATGGADLPRLLHRWALREGRDMNVLASDVSADVLAVARRALGRDPIQLVRHDALRLPFRDRSVDLVLCTQALHHFGADAAAQLLRELARVARIGVIVNDLVRGYVPYWGARLLALGPFSALSRHDGPLSVLRAYTPVEIGGLLARAELQGSIRRARGFRVEVEIPIGRA